MPQFIRQTAIPCTLLDIKEGEWQQNEGLSPSGVSTNRGIISRASVFGVIVDKTSNSIVLDDGTSTISARSFDVSPAKFSAEVGDLVAIIGRPREYDGERYLVMEICKKLKNQGWIDYRKKELENFKKEKINKITSEKPKAVEVPIEKNTFEKIAEKIRELDNGKGAQTEEILSSVQDPEAEKIVQAMIEEGEIFEIKPGMLKVLE